MKALRWHARKDLRYDDIPEPVPAPGQLKIKVSLTGICGTDMKEYSSGPVMIPPDKVPLTMGHEFVGYVVELGDGVTGFDIFYILAHDFLLYAPLICGLTCWIQGKTAGHRRPAPIVVTTYALAATASASSEDCFHGAFSMFQQGLFRVMSISRAKMAKPS